MSKSKVLKASLWYTISSFLLKGMGFITTPIFCRILTQEEYGIVNNFNAWLAIISVIGTFSLSASLVRARFDYKDELDSFVKTNLLFGSFVTALLGIVFCINSSFWSSFFVMDPKYIFVMCVTVFVYPAYDMFIQIEQFRYKYKIVTALSILITLSNIGLSLLFIWLLEDNLFARIIGGQLPVIIVGLILYIRFLIRGRQIKAKYLKYSISMCIPYMVHLLSGTLLASSDRTMITNMCGPNENALYSMAYNVALIVNVIWNAMNTAFSPWLGEKLDRKEYAVIKKNSYGYIAIFIFLVAGMMLIAPEVLWILGGERYIDAKVVIPPVMIGYVFMFLYSMYVNVEQFEKKTLGMAICTFGSALFNILLNWLMIPRFGYIAAAYTTLVSYFVMLVAHYCMVKKMRMQQCYDTKYIVVICLVSVLIGVISLLLYNNNLIRYIAILFYSVGAVVMFMKNREKIEGMMGR